MKFSTLPDHLSLSASSEMAPQNPPAATHLPTSSSELQDYTTYNFEVNINNFFDHHKTDSAMLSRKHSTSNLSAARLSQTPTSHQYTSVFSSTDHQSMNNFNSLNDHNPSMKMATYNSSLYDARTQDAPEYTPTLPSFTNANMDTHSFVKRNTGNMDLNAYSHMPYSFSAADNLPLSPSYHRLSTGPSVNNNIYQENMNTQWHSDHPNIADEMAPYNLLSHTYSIQEGPSSFMPLSPSRQYTRTSPATNNSSTYPVVLPRLTFFQLPRSVQIPDPHEEQRRRIEYLDYLMDKEAAIRAKIMINETTMQALGRRARKLERMKGVSISEEPVFGVESLEKRERLLSERREDGELQGVNEAGDEKLQVENGVGEHVQSVRGAEESQDNEKQPKTSNVNAELYRKAEEALEELTTHYEVAQQRIQRNEAWIERELEIQKKREEYELGMGIVRSEEEVEVQIQRKRGMPSFSEGGGRVFKESPRKRAKY